jgi:hypothetical protein
LGPPTSIGQLTQENIGLHQTQLEMNKFATRSIFQEIDQVWMKASGGIVPLHPAIRILNHPTSAFPERNAIDFALILSTEKRFELRGYIAIRDAATAIVDADIEIVGTELKGTHGVGIDLKCKETGIRLGEGIGKPYLSVTGV